MEMSPGCLAGNGSNSRTINFQPVIEGKRDELTGIVRGIDSQRSISRRS